MDPSTITRRKATRWLLAGAAAASPVLAAGCDRAAADSAAGESPVDPLAGYLPNIELTTQENRRVRFYDDLVRGKVVLINFMYATCSGI